MFRGDLDIIDEVISEDYIGDAGPAPSRYKAGNAATTRAFPDRKIRFDLLIAEGDCVPMHCTVEGTHLGEWRGIPRQASTPPGKRSPLRGRYRTWLAQLSNPRLGVVTCAPRTVVRAV